ncbi:hypothetical protein [Herbaspirillum sp. RV1423]|uniref:hypothetical protein n=1 Tax=Herbaspirillum sp. RV1423 TaxID=1443993 RepID=UPI0012DF28F7|nr:hypothetical protein [Herbaspirillum sp. RV1423]
MNRQEISTEMNRLRKLGFRGPILRSMSMENLAIKWGMFLDEVAEVFVAERL